VTASTHCINKEILCHRNNYDDHISEYVGNSLDEEAENYFNSKVNNKDIIFRCNFK
jgi:hypothetical protein